MTTDDKKPIIKQEGAPPVQQQQKRYRKRGNRHFYRKANNTQNTKLKGKTEELDGFVYDVGSMSQAQIFVDTTREIAEYTGRTLKEAQDIRMAIEDLEEITLNRPTKNRTGDDEENTAIFKIELDSYFKRLNAYRQNKATMYSIVLGQCTDAMRAKLEGDKRFNNIKVKSDVIELLKLIRSIAYDVEADSYPFMAQHAALKNYITHFQKFNTPNDVYLDNYNNLKEVLTHCGVTLGSNKILQDYTLKSKGLDPNIRYQNILSAAKKATEEAYDAIVFISGLNSHRYQGLIDSLANAYLNGRDEYPKNIVDAYKLINNWKGDQKNFSNRTEDEASFNQIGDGNVDANVNATTGRLKCRDGTDVKCVICGENHYPSNCPKRGTNQKEDAAPEETKHNNASTTNVTIKEEVTATQHTIRGNLEANWSDWEDNTDYKALMFLTNGVPNNAEIVKHIDNGSSFDEITNDKNAVGKYDHILKHSAGELKNTLTLLDNQSTVDLFSNGRMLTDIHEIKVTLKVHSTGGISRTNMIGHLPGYGWVWCYEKGIVNILSLERVVRNFRVTFDSSTDNKFHVYLANGRIRSFSQHDTGLYFSDLLNDKTGTVLINTVAYNKTKYSHNDYLRAVDARKLQNIIGNPSYSHFRRIIDNNGLKNCPITTSDIDAAEDIFGPSLNCLQGKTTRSKTTHARPNTAPVPSALLNRYRYIELTADVMYVNGLRFFITNSRHINFTTVQYIQDGKDTTLLNSIKSVKRVYMLRGFEIRHAFMDGEFESLRSPLYEHNIHLNICSNTEHVGEIERLIRTVKERSRSICASLPFKKYPGRLIVELIYSSVFWLNVFSPKQHLLMGLNPRTIITGQTVDYNTHCKYEFGQYVQTHEVTNNTMRARTIGALDLRPTGNIQGGYYFLSLLTGRRINRRHATPLPMPDDVITRIHDMAKTNPVGLDYRDRTKQPLIDEPDYDPDTPDGTHTFTPEHHQITGVPNSSIVSTSNTLDIPVNTSTAPQIHPSLDPSTAGVDDYTTNDNTGVNNYDNYNKNNNNHNTNNYSTDSDTTSTPVKLEPTTTEIQQHNPNINTDNDISSTESTPHDNDRETNTTPVDTSNDDFMDIEKMLNQNDAIRQTQQEMDNKYGTRLREGLRSRRKRLTIPAKFKGMEAASEDDYSTDEMSADLHMIRHTPLSLQNYAHIYAMLHCGVGVPDHHNVMTSDIVTTILTQYHVSKGLKIFGDEGVKAVLKELQQLHDILVIKPVKAQSLTLAQKKASLQYLMFLKQKRCGKIKG